MSENHGKQSRRAGLLRLRHLNEVAEAEAEAMERIQERFARLGDPASKARAVSSFNLFQTPEPLAAHMAGMFASFGRTLEPSAGLGRLYRAVRAVDDTCPMVLVDISPACCGELFRATAGDENADLFTGDFLEMDAAKLGTFDSIIMNPPFKNGADVKHIRRTMNLLRPGGRLVSLCASGPRQACAVPEFRLAVDSSSRWFVPGRGNPRRCRNRGDGQVRKKGTRP